MSLEGEFFLVDRCPMGTIYEPHKYWTTKSHISRTPDQKPRVISRIGHSEEAVGTSAGYTTNFGDGTEWTIKWY